MKKITLLIVVLIASIFTIAQPISTSTTPTTIQVNQPVVALTNQNYQQKAIRETDSLTVQLTLTQGQADSTKKILKNYFKKALELNRPTTLLPERARRLKQLERKKNKELQKIFNDTQYQQYKANQEALAIRMRQRRAALNQQSPVN